MPEFFGEWGRLVIYPITYSMKGWPAVAAVAKVALPVAGGSAAMVFWLMTLSVPFWLALGVSLSLTYLAVTGGMAWEKAKGRGLVMGMLELDEKWRDKIFCVRIENNGIAPLVNVRAAVTRLVDENGNTLLSPTWDVHWRDKKEGTETITLLGGHAAEAGVFQVERKADGSVRLSIRTPKDTATFVAFNTPPLQRPKKIIVDVVVTAEMKSGEHRRPVKRTFVLESWPETMAGYRVVEGGAE